MKLPGFIKITGCMLLVSLALLAARPTLCGEDPSPSPKPSATAGGITAEQWDKLKSAHETAMQDPKVQAAEAAAKEVWENYHAIVRKKVLAADPSIEPLLDKSDKVAAAIASGESPALLTADEKKALHDAFQKVESDPDIAAAMAKLEEAKKQRDAAFRAAILKADPSLEPVLEEIDRRTEQSSASATPSAPR